MMAYRGDPTRRRHYVIRSHYDYVRLKIATYWPLKKLPTVLIIKSMLV